MLNIQHFIICCLTVLNSLLLCCHTSGPVVCHCQDQQSCDPVTGFCTSGMCDTGWQGFPSCQTECSAGTFGQNCVGICHCPVDDTCVKNNGLCSSGACLHGWSGPSCQTRLPVMSKAPSVEVLGPEDVLLGWQQWSASTDAGQGPVAFYQVEYIQSGSTDWFTVDKVSESGSSEYSYTVTCLLPGTEYSFRLVLAMDMEGKHKMSVPSPATNYVLTAQQEVASPAEVHQLLPPMNPKVEYTTINSVQLSWQAASSSLTLSYGLSVELMESYSVNVHNAGSVLHTADTEVTLTQLEAASLYKVSLTAHTQTSLSSQPVVLTFCTQQQPFTKPPSPTLLNVTDTLVYAVIYPAKYTHAPPPTYMVVIEDLTIASTCPIEESLSHKLSSETVFEIVDYMSACSQNIAYYCSLVLEASELSEKGRVVVLGDNSTLADLWNVALHPQHEYIVWTCLDSQLPTTQHLTCEHSKERVLPVKGILYPRKLNVAAIVCGVLFSLLFVILVILCVIYCYRKQKQKKIRYQDIMSYHLGPTLYDTLTQSKNKTLSQPFIPTGKWRDASSKFYSQDEINLDENQVYTITTKDTPGIISRPIICEEFVSMYESQEKSVSTINEEFRQLPDGMLEDAVVARKPENQHYNRSSKVLPYDKNRVRLLKKTAIQNDYINASNIKTHMHTFYIVTQAPQENTVNDFWKMVWEQNVDCIVMLMGLQEDKQPCGQYWPDSEVVEFGDVEVCLLVTSHTAHYTVRWLKISQVVDGEQDIRNVAHFEYKTWTQAGTPHHPVPFLDFQQRVHDTHQDLYHMVVHCQLGTGRSGLFVALTSLLYEGKVSGRVEVMRAVDRLRHERPGLVRTQAQYKFLYEALVEAFHYRDTRFQENKYEFIYENMLSVSTPNNRSIIATEFDCLTANQRRPVLNRVFKWKDYCSYFSPAKMTPPIKYGIPNPALVEDVSCGLIVASMDSHRQKDQFLVTLYPCKQQQVLDFWHMVFEEGCCCVVMINETDISQPPYWPAQGESLGHEGIVVSTVTTRLDSTNAFYIRDIEIQVGCRKTAVRRGVKQFQWMVWPHCKEVPKVEHMLHFVELLRDWVKDREHVLVHSAHGVSRSAMLCVVWLVLERLEEEGVLDVYRTTMYTRSVLSAALTNLEQYRFVYKIARDKLHQERQKRNDNQSEKPDRGYNSTACGSESGQENVQLRNVDKFRSQKTPPNILLQRGGVGEDERSVQRTLYPHLSQHEQPIENTAYLDTLSSLTAQDRGDVHTSDFTKQRTPNGEKKSRKIREHHSNTLQKDKGNSRPLDTGLTYTDIHSTRHTLPPSHQPLHCSKTIEADPHEHFSKAMVTDPQDKEQVSCTKAMVRVPSAERGKSQYPATDHIST